MKLEAVLFDLDGTLIDSSAGIESSARRAMQHVFPEAPVPSFRPFIGPPIRQIFQAAMESIGIDECANAAMGELESLYRSDYDGRGWEMSEPYDGVIPLLDFLADRGIARYIVTNKPAVPTGNILRHLGLADRMSGVVSRDSRRPDFSSKAEAVASLLARRQIDPKTAILVGDSEDDAEAARENGIEFIAALYGYGFENDAPRDAIASLASLSELGLLLEDDILMSGNLHRIHGPSERARRIGRIALST